MAYITLPSLFPMEREYFTCDDPTFKVDIDDPDPSIVNIVKRSNKTLKISAKKINISSHQPHGSINNSRIDFKEFDLYPPIFTRIEDTRIQFVRDPDTPLSIPPPLDENPDPDHHPDFNPDKFVGNWTSDSFHEEWINPNNEEWTNLYPSSFKGWDDPGPSLTNLPRPVPVPISNEEKLKDTTIPNIVNLFDHPSVYDLD